MTQFDRLSTNSKTVWQNVFKLKLDRISTDKKTQFDRITVTQFDKMPASTYKETVANLPVKIPSFAI